MARRRLFWHIGTDDLGTGFLADALDVRREALAEAGVLVPGTAASWELATAELRRNHQQLGYRRREVEGQNAALVRLAWKHKGTSVLSTPGLASATPDQVMLALDGVRGAEIHLVLLARDLTSQVYAAAQAALELGGTTGPERYVSRVLDPAALDHPQSLAYRAGHDLPDILNRWARTLPPEHVHVIGETEPTAIWTRLTALLGVHVPFPEQVAPSTLDLPRLEVLRGVSLGLDDRLDARGRRTTLRDWVSRELLAGVVEPLPPVGLQDQLADWTERIRRRGFDLQGALRSDPGSPPRTTTDARHVDLATSLADAATEVDRLRRENRRLTEQNERLDRKRRKHKRRLLELNGRDVA